MSSATAKLLVIYLCLASAGCNPYYQTYASTRLPSASVAVLRDPYPRHGNFHSDFGKARSVHIRYFGGVVVDAGFGLELLPGPHRVAIVAQWSNRLEELYDIVFVATAGKMMSPPDTN